MTLYPASLRATRSNPETSPKQSGLLRRFAPRNDGEMIFELNIRIDPLSAGRSERQQDKRRTP
jgi:hypothetical protein